MVGAKAAATRCPSAVAVCLHKPALLLWFTPRVRAAAYHQIGLRRTIGHGRLVPASRTRLEPWEFWCAVCKSSRFIACRCDTRQSRRSIPHSHPGAVCPTPLCHPQQPLAAGHLASGSEYRSQRKTAAPRSSASPPSLAAAIVASHKRRRKGQGQA